MDGYEDSDEEYNSLRVRKTSIFTLPVASLTSAWHISQQVLADCKLSKYFQVFRENEVTAEALPLLTEEELADMDIPLGARKRIKLINVDAVINERNSLTAADEPNNVPFSPQV